jgi:hypothetical protein
MHLAPWQFRQVRQAPLQDDLGIRRRHRGHTHASMAISRRQFLGTAVGAAGLLLGSSVLPPARAALCVDPRPIPGGFSEFGHFYHQRYPDRDTADTEDPSTVTDFNGHIGLAYVEGMGTHTDKTTGLVSHLPYRVDLRFMKGVYVGRDGKHHYGAFAAV